MSAQLVNVHARIAEIHAMIALPPAPARPAAGGSDFANALADAEAREAGSTATAERAPDPAWAQTSAGNAPVLAPGTPVARLRPGATAGGSATGGSATAVDGAGGVGAANAASPARAAAPASEAPSGAAGNRILKAAERYLGVPYKWGGTNPSTGLDCSGFTQRVFRDLGETLPRVSYDQAAPARRWPAWPPHAPATSSTGAAAPGGRTHIGIYAGNGKMIHAPRRGDVVKYDSIRTAPPDAIRRVL